MSIGQLLHYGHGFIRDYGDIESQLMLAYLESALDDLS